MEFIVEQLATQSMVFMRRVGAYGNENYKLMSELKKWANLKGIFKESTIYGIAQDNPMNTPQEQCRYDVCLIVANDYPVDEKVQRGEIPGGKYAIFTVTHTAKAVQKFWSLVMNVLYEKGLQYDVTKPILERYKYRIVEDGKCEFCVPII